VTLREGAVVVDGGVLGAGVPLRAGQRLRVERGGMVRTETIEAPALAARPEAPPPVAPRPAADWAGAGRAGWRTARRCGRWSGADLDVHAEDPGRRAGCSRWADVARYAGAPETALLTFERLAAAFSPGTTWPPTPFSALGGWRSRRGTRGAPHGWFGAYVQRWPEGTLAEPAAAPG
jgi:hypothetical protein